MRRFATAMIASTAMFCGTTGIAHADPDTEFAAELHTYGIYGGKDYNAWIGKIACERLDNGVDADAGKSAKFVLLQLEKDSTTKQVWQFLGAALRTYCPEKFAAGTGGGGRRGRPGRVPCSHVGEAFATAYCLET